MRYVIKYSKESEIKFISHLDLMRTIQRIIRRSKLPVEYSKGFNPHMSLSIAQPLSVGVYSSGEYLDTVFIEEVEENYIKDVFNENSPAGIKALEVVKVPQMENVKRVPQSMALVEAASYTIKLRYKNADKLEENLKELLNKKEWITLKKSKKGEKEADIRELISEFKYKIEDSQLILDVVVSCGSKENLSADLIARYVKSNTENAEENAFTDIKRNELYTLSENKIISLGEYYKQKVK